ncbi:MAG: hypothetical protein V4444_04135 [Pseudomonadota bacterium]
MMRVPMSPAAAALYRALVVRANVPRDQALLTSIHSVDWQSLTLSGERHEIAIRLAGPDAAYAARSLCHELADAEFAISGLIVADIELAGRPITASDGSIEVRIEALTIEE